VAPSTVRAAKAYRLLSIEQAVPIGLIVNRLITNSIKHAFGPEGGSVRVGLHATGNPGYATVTVADNREGLAEDDGGVRPQAGSRADPADPRRA
jgi:two-component sensor histidine kinase